MSDRIALDRDAFTDLVHAHHLALVRTCYVVVGDLEAARDAVQSTWLRLWREPPALRDSSKLRPWLAAGAINEARQRTRRDRRGRILHFALRQREDAPPGTEDAIDLAAALRRLTDDERELLALRYVLELESAAIGAHLGISPEGARTRLHRLLQKLREEVGYKPSGPDADESSAPHRPTDDPNRR